MLRFDAGCVMRTRAGRERYGEIVTVAESASKRLEEYSARHRARDDELVAVPDGGRQLSDGVVVEGSVVARLFGIRLLAIDASLVISPAHVKGPSPARGGASVAWIPVTAPVTPHTRSRTIGPGLAAAERFIDERAASLAASRVTGTSASRPQSRR